MTISALPSNPSNGQVAVLQDVIYRYDTDKTRWEIVDTIVTGGGITVSPEFSQTPGSSNIQGLTIDGITYNLPQEANSVVHLVGATLRTINPGDLVISGSLFYLYTGTAPVQFSQNTFVVANLNSDFIDVLADTNGVVRFDETQTLTVEEQARAQSNLGLNSNEPTDAGEIVREGLNTLPIEQGYTYTSAITGLVNNSVSDNYIHGGNSRPYYQLEYPVSVRGPARGTRLYGFAAGNTPDPLVNTPDEADFVLEFISTRAIPSSSTHHLLQFYVVHGSNVLPMPADRFSAQLDLQPGNVFETLYTRVDNGIHNPEMLVRVGDGSFEFNTVDNTNARLYDTTGNTAYEANLLVYDSSNVLYISSVDIPAGTTANPQPTPGDLQVANNPWTPVGGGINRIEIPGAFSSDLLYPAIAGAINLTDTGVLFFTTDNPFIRQILIAIGIPPEDIDVTPPGQPAGTDRYTATNNVSLELINEQGTRVNTVNVIAGMSELIIPRATIPGVFVNNYSTFTLTSVELVNSAVQGVVQGINTIRLSSPVAVNGPTVTFNTSDSIEIIADSNNDFLQFDIPSGAIDTDRLADNSVTAAKVTDEIALSADVSSSSFNTREVQVIPHVGTNSVNVASGTDTTELTLSLPYNFNSDVSSISAPVRDIETATDFRDINSDRLAIQSSGALIQNNQILFLNSNDEFPGRADEYSNVESISGASWSGIRAALIRLPTIPSDLNTLLAAPNNEVVVYINRENYAIFTVTSINNVVDIDGNTNYVALGFDNNPPVARGSIQNNIRLVTRGTASRDPFGFVAAADYAINLDTTGTVYNNIVTDRLPANIQSTAALNLIARELQTNTVFTANPLRVQDNGSGNITDVFSGRGLTAATGDASGALVNLNFATPNSIQVGSLFEPASENSNAVPLLIGASYTFTDNASPANTLISGVLESATTTGDRNQATQRIVLTFSNFNRSAAAATYSGPVLVDITRPEGLFVDEVNDNYSITLTTAGDITSIETSFVVNGAIPGGIVIPPIVDSVRGTERNSMYTITDTSGGFNPSIRAASNETAGDTIDRIVNLINNDNFNSGINPAFTAGTQGTGAETLIELSSVRSIPIDERWSVTQNHFGSTDTNLTMFSAAQVTSVGGNNIRGLTEGSPVTISGTITTVPTYPEFDPAGNDSEENLYTLAITRESDGDFESAEWSEVTANPEPPEPAGTTNPTHVPLRTLRLGGTVYDIGGAGSVPNAMVSAQFSNANRSINAFSNVLQERDFTVILSNVDATAGSVTEAQLLNAVTLIGATASDSITVLGDPVFDTTNNTITTTFRIGIASTSNPGTRRVRFTGSFPDLLDNSQLDAVAIETFISVVDAREGSDVSRILPEGGQVRTIFGQHDGIGLFASQTAVSTYVYSVAAGMRHFPLQSQVDSGSAYAVDRLRVFRGADATATEILPAITGELATTTISNVPILLPGNTGHTIEPIFFQFASDGTITNPANQPADSFPSATRMLTTYIPFFFFTRPIADVSNTFTPILSDNAVVTALQTRISASNTSWRSGVQFTIDNTVDGTESMTGEQIYVMISSSFTGTPIIDSGFGPIALQPIIGPNADADNPLGDPVQLTTRILDSDGNRIDHGYRIYRIGEYNGALHPTITYTIA